MGEKKKQLEKYLVPNAINLLMNVSKKEKKNTKKKLARQTFQTQRCVPNYMMSQPIKLKKPWLSVPKKLIGLMLLRKMLNVKNVLIYPKKNLISFQIVTRLKR